MLKSIKAGVSIVDVTPPEGVELAGYPHCPRNNTGFHDPLFAGCIMLDDGETKLAIVSMDLLMYSKKYTARVRKNVSEKTKISAKNIMISCSHSHSAPWTSGRLDLEALEKGMMSDESYVKVVEKKLTELILNAYNNTFDAEIGIEKGYCGKEQGVGGNRRDPSGPADPDVWVMGIKDLKGNIKGCLVKYALHPTVLHSESTLVSADYPGYVREYLSTINPDMHLLFAQGTSGNQSTRYFRTGQTFDEAKRIGYEIGKETSNVLKIMKFDSNIKLICESQEVELELRKFPPRKIAEENVKKAELEFERLKASNAKYIDLQNAELKLLGAEDILGYIILSEKNIKPELLTDELPAEIQVLGIGESRIVGLQGEIFVEFGLEIKNKSPFEKTFVIELANGVLPGYVYTKEALKEGGYETDTSMLGENCGEIITRKAIELLNKTK